jgi:hypothetical protein
LLALAVMVALWPKLTTEGFTEQAKLIGCALLTEDAARAAWLTE